MDIEKHDRVRQWAVCAVFAGLCVVRHLAGPPTNNGDLCQNEIILQELERMDDSERMVMDHYEFVDEILNELADCNRKVERLNDVCSPDGGVP